MTLPFSTEEAIIDNNPDYSNIEKLYGEEVSALIKSMLTSNLQDRATTKSLLYNNIFIKRGIFEILRRIKDNE